MPSGKHAILLTGVPGIGKMSSPHRVSRYGVDVGALDRIVDEALARGCRAEVMKATPEMVKLINEALPADTNLILHVTC